MKNKAVGAAVLAFACALGAYGMLSWNSTSAAAESGTITIGVILPLTGEAAHWGIPPRNGAEMAVDEINRDGGVGADESHRRVQPHACVDRRDHLSHLLVVASDGDVVHGRVLLALIADDGRDPSRVNRTHGGRG